MELVLDYLHLYITFYDIWSVRYHFCLPLRAYKFAIYLKNITGLSAHINW